MAFQALLFETCRGLRADARALLKRLQGLLNQAIIAQEDVEGYCVLPRVRFIMVAAVGRQLAWTFGVKHSCTRMRTSVRVCSAYASETRPTFFKYVGILSSQNAMKLSGKIAYTLCIATMVFLLQMIRY